MALGSGAPGGRGSPEARPRGQARPAPGSASSAPILPLDQAMARHIESALAHCGGRIEGPQGAARLLEINPHTLRARMRKLGIHWGSFRRSESADRKRSP
jgi:transcriptional regulator with GAF, ATPase, and Fis domain